MPESTWEHVLRQFWQTFVDDRFDLENAIQTNAEFSYALTVMDKIGGWEAEKLGRIQVRSKHVDQHQGCDLQRSKDHARIQAPQIQIHHGTSDLGVRRCPG